MKFENMSIDERFEFAQREPERFSELALSYLDQTIQDICSRSEKPGQCEWRLRGVLLRVNTEADKLKDPVARLNFIFGNMWKSFEDLNQALNKGVL